MHETSLVSTPIGDSISAERVYRAFPITFLDRVTYDELTELTMLDIDIILGVEWLHIFYATIDCRNRVVRFHFPNEVEMER